MEVKRIAEGNPVGSWTPPRSRAGAGPHDLSGEQEDGADLGLDSWKSPARVDSRQQRPSRWDKPLDALLAGGGLGELLSRFPCVGPRGNWALGNSLHPLSTQPGASCPGGTQEHFPDVPRSVRSARFLGPGAHSQHPDQKQSPAS